jgi:hypothetical protein
MKAIIFKSSEDLINQLMTMERDVDNDEEYYRGIYSESMSEIRRLHTEYPYIVKTKKYSCFIV